MRITFDNTHPNTDKVTTTYNGTHAKETDRLGAYTADISGTVMDNNAYGVQGRTAEDVMQDAQATDITAQHNYMAVMSNSMSTEDFSKMLREGADPNDMDVETVITIVDRIKAELMKAGVTVTGYTDDIDSAALAEIVGSEGLAGKLINAFEQNDIPVTMDNVRMTVDALNEALKLSQPTDGELKFLVNNSLEPTVENIYTAEHAGAVDANRQGKGYYRENFGYYAKKADALDFDKLLPQVERIIAEAGLEINEETIGQAQWIIEKGIPLTAGNISCLNENSKISFPVNEEEVIQAFAAAIANGNKPMQANLTHTENKYQKATELSQSIDKKVAEWLNDGSVSVTAKRRLEEARLRMTAEVNIRLAESGFSIDTANLEELVEALKKAEEEQAKRMFPGQSSAQAIENYGLYKDTLLKTSLLPGLPAATLGKLIFEEKLTVNIDNLADEGTKLRAGYERAETSYEALMTVPRKDLGDSIRKAFANVDDILTDLGIEITSENQRCVRILAYNNIPIIPDNINQVKTTDRMVQRVINRMTPSSTLQMIRDGINPLTTDMSELEQYFKDKSDDPNQEMETYSRFLYNMEQSKEITPEERDAYIGVYRMLRQIEKSDGAVIGSVLKSQSDLNFKQLLAAARSAKKAGMNILVDETFGGLEDLRTQGEAIDEQINNIDTIRSLKDAEKDVIKTLNQLDLPVTANYVMAAAAVSEGSGPLFAYVKERLYKKQDKPGKNEAAEQRDRIDESNTFESMADKLTDALTGKDEMQNAYKEFGEQITDFIKDNLYTPGQTSLDVKAMKSANLQISVAMKMSAEETYDIPVMLGDAVTAIRLTIRHRSEDNGLATISLETEKYGKVQAYLQVRQNSVTGYITGKGEALESMETVKDKLSPAFDEQGMKLDNFQVIENDVAVSFKKLEKGEVTTSSATIYEAAKIVIKTISDIL